MRAFVCRLKSWWHRSRSFTASPDSVLRARSRLLQNVRRTWIQGVLKKSLHARVAIELGMKESPVNVQRDHPLVKSLLAQGTAEQPVPAGITVRSIFEQSSRSLLILGAPASGKTFTLLQLTEQLLDEAEADSSEPIPVVVSLSSWPDRNVPFIDWLKDVMFREYGVPAYLCDYWLSDGSLCLILDGLDEPAEEPRTACIQAVNQLRSNYSVDLVMTSRVQDYQDLTVRLNVATAICLQPLTELQIDDYLREFGQSQRNLREMLAVDRQWLEMARSPLFLNLLALTFAGSSEEEIEFAGQDDRVRRLCRRFVHMCLLNHLHVPTGAKWTKNDAAGWLLNLARGMSKHRLTIFHMESLQPSWLKSGDSLIWSVASWMAASLFVAIIAVIANLGQIICGWHEYSNSAPEDRFPGVSPVEAAALLFLLSGAAHVALALFIGGAISVIHLVAAELFQRPARINLVEKLRPSWCSFKRAVATTIPFGCVIGMTVVALPVVAACVAAYLIIAEHLEGIVFVFIFVTVLLGALPGSAWGLIAGFVDREVQSRDLPNQGISASRRSAFMATVIVTIVLFWLLAVAFNIDFLGGFDQNPNPLTEVVYDTALALANAVLLGMIAAYLPFGGLAWIRHRVLRFILSRSGTLPFGISDARLIRLLDSFEECILLQRVGGGWRFVHRQIQEYLASVSQENPRDSSLAWQKESATATVKPMISRSAGMDTALADQSSRVEPVNVFISYAHSDEHFKDELVKRLSNLKRQNVIDVWHDRLIDAGDEWDPLIRRELENADLILFLLSPDFLASPYIESVEMKIGLARCASSEARVIPIILRPCDWNEDPQLNRLAALPKDARPVTQWEQIGRNEDEAFLDITRGLRRVAERIREA